MLKNQTPLTRDRFVRITRGKLSTAGIEASHYSGHSFRIGAATTASAYGVEDSDSNSGPLEEHSLPAIYSGP